MKLTLILIPIIYIISVQLTKSDESPGFFLKVINNKNVPRLGKRSTSLDKYFRKTSKNVPRIGRRSNEYMEPGEDESSWYDEFTLPQKRILTDLSSNNDKNGFYEYNFIQPVDSNQLFELLSKDIIPNENLKFISWKDFDKALQMDIDLFSKILSIGEEANFGKFKQDINYRKFMPILDNTEPDDLIFYRNGDKNHQLTKEDRNRMEYNM